MACLFFHDGPIRNYADAIESDTERYAKFFWGMLERGVYPRAVAVRGGVHEHRPRGEPHRPGTLAAAREVFKGL